MVGLRFRLHVQGYPTVKPSDKEIMKGYKASTNVRKLSSEDQKQVIGWSLNLFKHEYKF